MDGRLQGARFSPNCASAQVAAPKRESPPRRQQAGHDEQEERANAISSSLSRSLGPCQADFGVADHVRLARCRPQ